MNNPEILWAQNKNKVFVTINISSIINEWVDINEDKIHFRGGNGDNNYDLSINLLHNVDILKSVWITNDNGVFITLEKKEIISWVKLSNIKYNNLKIDWNRWEDIENEDLDSDQENMINDFSNFKKTLPSELMNKDFTELFNKDLDTEITADDENLEENCISNLCNDEPLEIENELFNKMEEGKIIE